VAPLRTSVHNASPSATPQLYEEKRKETLAILEDTDSKRVQVQSVLKSIDDRISELSAEMAELDKYNALERRRRALEYTLYSTEMAKSQAELDEMARNKDDDAGQTLTLRAAMEEHQAAVASLESELRTVGEALKSADGDRKALVAAKPKIAKARVQAEGQLAELRTRAEEATVRAADLSRELAEVQVRAGGRGVDGG